MKKFLMIIAISAMITSCSKDENLMQDQSVVNTESNFQVLFETPIPYSELESRIDQLGISKSSVVVTHNFSLGGTPFRGFIPLRENSNEISFNETINKGISGLENETEIQTGKYASKSGGSVSRSKELYNVSEMMITNVTVDESKVSDVFSTSKVIRSEKRDIAGTEKESKQYSQKSGSSDSWIPDAYGYRIQESTSYTGKRYLLTAMIWATTDPFGDWSDNVTFEPDFNLNNSSNSSLGPGTYLDDSEYINGVPNVHYAASSLPRAYLDTRDTDANHIKTFTIGCADAAEIESFKQYKNYIVTDEGDADQDNAQVIFQRGQRWPSNVYNTWSVFNDDFYVGGVLIVDIDNVVPSERPFGSGWPISVPGTDTWYK